MSERKPAIEIEIKDEKLWITTRSMITKYVFCESSTSLSLKELKEALDEIEILRR